MGNGLRKAFFLGGILYFLICMPLQSVAQEEVRLQMLSSKLGTAAYALGHALSEIVNKHHPWLRMESLQTSGMVENLMTPIKVPGKRKNTVFFASKYMIHQAKVADRPFKKSYKNFRAICRVGMFADPFATLDPKIKTKDDLIGKKISLPVKGTAVWTIPKFIMDHGWGIWDKVKIEPGMFWAQGKNALLDGMIDVSLQSVVKIGNKWVGTPATSELMATKPTYWVSLGDPKAIKIAREKSGYPIGIIKIPAGALGPTQPDPIWSADFPNNWYVDAAMDEKVVYELVKTIYEYAQEFAKYHALGRGITKDSMAEIAIAEEDFHPGAVKLYKEKGVKIGSR
ncbi:TAXI family TRAP transporter solute-binding subunit [Thermodesulfobacteriota bacterium]